MINILILSAGTRNKIVQYFKKELGDGGRVIATDMQDIAPAIYEADAYYLVPRVTDPGYVDVIIDICKKENVTGVLSLIDPELSILAKNEQKFKEIGTTIIGSTYELCERALDKIQMYQWLKDHDYKCARSYTDIELFFADVEDGKVNYPVFVKPYDGSASLYINTAKDKDTVKMLFNHREGLMVQELLNGQEIGVDCYIDIISGEVISIFAKKKLLMKAGETDKSISFKDEKLFDLVERFIKESGWRGQIDIDIFEINGEYYISEVNPRFGGGYPHAYECGVNHMKYIVNNLQGEVNHKTSYDYEDGIVMMKYNEIMIKKF